MQIGRRSTLLFSIARKPAARAVLVPVQSIALPVRARSIFLARRGLSVPPPRAAVPSKRDLLGVGFEKIRRDFDTCAPHLSDDLTSPTKQLRTTKKKKREGEEGKKKKQEARKSVNVVLGLLVKKSGRKY